MTNPRNISDAFGDLGRAAQKMGENINGNDLGVQKKPIRPAARMNESTPLTKLVGGFAAFLTKVGALVILAKLISYISHPGSILLGFYQAGWLEVCYPLIASLVVLFAGIIVIAVVRVLAKYA